MVKKSQLVSKLQSYIEEEAISHEEVDIGEKTLDDIKSDFIELSKYFVLIFNEFRYNFIDFDDKEISNMINELKVISLEVVLLNQSVDSKMSYGKFEAKENLTDYIQSKYYLIIDFFNLYNEVFA